MLHPGGKEQSIKSLDASGVSSSLSDNSDVGLLNRESQSVRLLTIIGLSFLLVSTEGYACAKPWRGIVPLHSTRDDVQKILGKPTSQNEIFEDYKLDRYVVTVWYASENCDGPAPYWWGNYRVSRGTVLSVEVEFDEVPLTKLRIRKINKLVKGPPDSSLAVDYFDKRRGLQYSIRSRKLYRVTYGPSAVDAQLRCRSS